MKRNFIEPDHPQISVRRQCELLGLNRSTLYYQPAGDPAYNLHLMRLIDEQYLRTPFYGWPHMTAYLRRQGYDVNGKRIRRLMQQMGLQALYPKPKTSVAAIGHKIYVVSPLYDLTRCGAQTLPIYPCPKAYVSRRHYGLV